MQTATTVPTATPTPTATPVATTVPPVSDVVSEGISKVTEATSGFIQSLPLLATRLIFAAVALIIGYLLLRIGRKVITRIIHKKSKEVDHRTYQQRETLQSLIQSIFTYLMYFIIATMVLSIFGVDVSSLLALAGVSGVAIGFGAQTLIKDIISGVFLWSEGNISVGDRIIVNSLTGTVESIALRTTKLRDYNGDLYVIPNGDIRTVVNESHGFKRAIVKVRLNYNDNIQKTLEILQDELQKSRDAIPGLREVPTFSGITDMAADCLIVEVSAQCAPAVFSDAERALRLRIIQRFEQENILFPHTPVMDTTGTKS